MKTLKEKWKKIRSYNYEVSNFGNVRSIRTGRHLKPRLCPNYLQVRLYNDYGAKEFKVHQLVVNAFSPVCINHKNGDKLDNNLSNLERVTYKENTRHAVEELGVSNLGNAKLTINDAKYIKNSKLTSKELAAKFNINYGHVNKIRRGETWSDA